MQKKYSYIFFLLFALLFGTTLVTPSDLFASSPIGIADSIQIANQRFAQLNLSDTRNNKPQDLKLSYKPFTPFDYYYKHDNSKTLSDVKVFPNPVTDQINLIFKLNKDSKVTIKVMDALGNEVSTLLSQNLTQGEQNQSFMTNGKFGSGYYFIRIIAGSETIVKRIQVL